MADMGENARDFGFAFLALVGLVAGIAALNRSCERQSKYCAEMLGSANVPEAVKTQLASGTCRAPQ
jgi:hypothetical protein